MNKEKQLLKNTAIVTIGKICTQLITFLLLPLYTYVLSTEEYGIVDLLNTLVSLFIPIVTLQIEQGVFRYLIDCREDKEKEKKVITTSILFMVAQTILYLVIFACASQFIHNSYKYFLAVNLVANVFANILLQISRGMGDNTKYAIGSFLSGAVTVILNVIFIVLFKWGAYGMLFATLIGNLMCAMYLTISKEIYKKVSIKLFDKALLKEILKYSIPLVPNMISWWVVNASDRMIVTAALGVATNGIYSAAHKFSSVLMTLNAVINMTWTESASLNIEKEDRDEFFSKIFNVILRIFGSLCLGVVAYMPFVFPILINEKFGDAYYQIPILIIATIFNILVSFLGAIYVAKKLTKEIAKTSIFAGIINIVLDITLINFIGLYAASVSTAVAYFSMFMYRFIDSKKYVNLHISKKIVISLIAMSVATIICYYIRNTALNLIMAIFVTIYAAFVNRNSFKFMLNMLKKKRTS